MKLIITPIKNNNNHHCNSTSMLRIVVIRRYLTTLTHETAMTSFRAPIKKTRALPSSMPMAVLDPKAESRLPYQPLICSKRARSDNNPPRACSQRVIIKLLLTGPIIIITLAATTPLLRKQVLPTTLLITIICHGKYKWTTSVVSPNSLMCPNLGQVKT